MTIPVSRGVIAKHQVNMGTKCPPAKLSIGWKIHETGILSIAGHTRQPGRSLNGIDNRIPCSQNTHAAIASSPRPSGRPTYPACYRLRMQTMDMLVNPADLIRRDIHHHQDLAVPDSMTKFVPMNIGNTQAEIQAGNK